MYVYNVHSQKIANHSHILSLTRTQVIASVAELQLLVPRPAGVNVQYKYQGMQCMADKQASHGGRYSNLLS